MFVNLFTTDCSCLLEDRAAGDQSIPLALSGRAAKAITALLALESFEVSAALGELFLAGVREGGRAARRPPLRT